MKIHTRHLIALLALIAFATPAMATDKAGVLTYEKKWQGVVGGDECYYIPSNLVGGDFLPGNGEEILIVDDSNYAHLFQWKDTGLREIWITDNPVIKGRIRDAEAADVNADGLEEVIFVSEDGKVSVFGNTANAFGPICSHCLADTLRHFRIFAIGKAKGPGKKDYLAALGKRGAEVSMFELEWRNHSLAPRRAARFDSISGTPIDIAAAADYKPGNFSYFLLYINPEKKKEIAGVEVDEEGTAYTLSPHKLPGEFNSGDTASIILDTPPSKRMLMMALGYDGNTGQSVAAFAPDTGRTARYAGIQQGAGFFGFADINLDGDPEIVFTDYNCNIEIHSRAISPPVLVIDGAPRSGASIARQSGTVIMANAAIMPGTTVKFRKNTAHITRGSRKITIDIKTGSAQLVTTGKNARKTSKNITLTFTIDKKNVFISVDDLTEYLGIHSTRDYFNGNITIK